MIFRSPWNLLDTVGNIATGHASQVTGVMKGAKPSTLPVPTVLLMKSASSTFSGNSVNALTKPLKISQIGPRKTNMPLAAIHLSVMQL